MTHYTRDKIDRAIDATTAMLRRRVRLTCGDHAPIEAYGAAWKRWGWLDTTWHRLMDLRRAQGQWRASSYGTGVRHWFVSNAAVAYLHLKDARGRTRWFKTLDAAQRAANKLNAETPQPHSRFAPSQVSRWLSCPPAEKRTDLAQRWLV